MSTAIWWIRKDLRLSDNQALAKAMELANHVIPLFILDDFLWRSPYVGEKRIAFLLEGLRGLDQSLKERGSWLIIRSGEPEQVLWEILGESGASVVVTEEDYSPYARKRDQLIESQLPVKFVPGLTVHHPTRVLKSDKTPYTVFTPYSRAWLSAPLPNVYDVLPAPQNISTPTEIASLSIPNPPDLPFPIPFEAGEEQAQKILTSFVSGDEPPVYSYGEQRNRPDLAGTSKLSPYLRFGMVSARQVVVAVHTAIQHAPNAEARKSAQTWLSEVIWREFYQTILYHFPHVRQTSFRENTREIQWANNLADFEAWCNGQTGYPIVDAAMRQLLRTGWMHNRLRMIAASFLTKDLLIDWRWGERWFMQHLVDGDPAANNGGWQWTAGTGTDAAPYFRVFNPVRQGEKFDPEGDFVRQWVPELAHVPVEYIHEPWRMAVVQQEKAGCKIGEDYPMPVVDHSWAHERVLDAYKNAREIAPVTPN